VELVLPLPPTPVLLALVVVPLVVDVVVVLVVETWVLVELVETLPPEPPAPLESEEPHPSIEITNPAQPNSPSKYALFMPYPPICKTVSC
jgi:hypothetical protein